MCEALKKSVVSALILAACLQLCACSFMGGKTDSFENGICKMTNIRIDTSGALASVSATFENKTDRTDSFVASVVLLDSEGNEIGETIVLSEELASGQSGPSTTGLILMGDHVVEVDDPILNTVVSIEVESAISQIEMKEYMASEANNLDPLIGYWKCLEVSLEGETYDLKYDGTAYAQFKEDGTWVLTLGDENHEYVWMLSGDETVPYLLTFANQAWAGIISDSGMAGEVLLLASLDDPIGSNMTLLKVDS